MNDFKEPSVNTALVCTLRMAVDEPMEAYRGNVLEPIAQRVARRPDVIAVHYCLTDDLTELASGLRQTGHPDALPDATLVVDIKCDADTRRIVSLLDLAPADITVLLCNKREVLNPSHQLATDPDCALQFCSFSRQPGQSAAEFERIWLEEHTHVAVETQSTFGYRQYRVLDVLEGDFYADAIVEEHFPVAALANPKVFFAAADDKQLKQNVDRMMSSCARFIGPGSVNVIHFRETTIKKDTE